MAKAKGRQPAKPKKAEDEQGFAAFLTSHDLINQYILASNVYTLSFAASARKTDTTVKIPYFTPDLEKLALEDLHRSNELITEAKDDTEISYPRIRKYLVALFSGSDGESLELYNTLTTKEKLVLRVCLQSLQRQARSHQGKK